MQSRGWRGDHRLDAAQNETMHPGLESHRSHHDSPIAPVASQDRTDAMKAVFNNVVLAESTDIVTVDGNPYFPRASMNQEFFKESSLTTVCGWKGTARYWDVVVDGQVLSNVVWSYDTPKPAAEEIRERFAFYRGKGVDVIG